MVQKESMWCKMNQKVLIVRLDEDHAKKFEDIKKLLGLKSDAETVRYIIHDFYKSTVQKESETQ